jgi:ribosomal protein L11 methyltransferase
MHILRLACHRDDKDLLIARLWELGTTGIQEEELPEFRWLLHGYFDEPFSADEFAANEPEWRVESGATDWVARSREPWRAMAVGQRLWLAPEWDGAPAPDGRVRLASHPGMASGSGYQPATRLALEALEETLRESDTVLDAGTGSGILTAAAYLLGARRLVACDVDPSAARIAAQNFRRDDVTASVFAGSPRGLCAGWASLIVANLNAWALRLSAGELARVAAAGARLVVAGFQERREGAVAAAFGRLGFVAASRRMEAGWVCLTFRRE